MSNYKKGKTVSKAPKANRHERRRIWATFEKKKDRSIKWDESMQSIPDLFPIIRMTPKRTSEGVLVRHQYRKYKYADYLTEDERNELRSRR